MMTTPPSERGCENGAKPPSRGHCAAVVFFLNTCDKFVSKSTIHPH